MEELTTSVSLSHAVKHIHNPLTPIQRRAKLSLVDSFLEYWRSAPFHLMQNGDKTLKNCEIAKEWNQLLNSAAEIIVRIQREIKKSSNNVFFVFFKLL